jgi:hypothetical protein
MGVRVTFFTEIYLEGSQKIHNFLLISDLKVTFHKNASKKDNLEKLVFHQNPVSGKYGALGISFPCALF